MSQRKTAQQHGRILFEMAKEAGSLDKVSKDLKKIAGVLQDKPEVARYFSATPAKDDDLQSLVKVLIWSSEVFQKLVDEHKDILEVRVESAHTLSKDMQKTLIKKIEDKEKKKVQLHCSIDKNLIAGFKLFIGEKLIDCSTAGQLKQMKETMLATQ